MKNLILGGAGFIGQHLAHRLLNDGEVTIVDNLKTSAFDADDFDRYGESFRFIEGDLTAIDDDFLLSLFNEADKIYYLAGAVGVAWGDKDPKYTMNNNIKLASKLVPLFEQAGKHVVFSSTSEVYGNGPTFREDDPVGIGPSSKLRWAYATTKLMTEFMLRASGIPHTIVRFFNVVGPGQIGDYGMVLPKFINAAINDEPMFVHGNGQQIRAFCHINDAIDALVAVSNISGEIFNIGNDVPMTIEQLAERIKHITESKSPISYVPYSDAFSANFEDIMYRVPNLDKLKASTGYQPRYNIDQIIEDTIRWAKGI